MAGFSTEAKVGVFVMVGLAVLAYMTIRLGKFQFSEAPGYQVWAVFDNATGLKKNAPVEMAGIQIGLVDKIELDRGRAKLTMRIRPEVKLATDSAASIRTRGVLGDKYVALEAGSASAPLLKEGDELAKAKVPDDLEQVMARVGAIADDVKDITASLRVSVASPESQEAIKESLANLRELTGSLKVVVADNQQRLNRVVENVDKFTSDLAQVSGENKKALSETIRNFLAVSDQLGRTITGLSSVIEKVDRGEGSLGALVNERRTVDELNSTLTSLKQIAKKIDEGKGSIGKLVNDDTTVTKIDEALTGINDYLTRADAWRVYVDYRGEFMFNDSAMRSTVNLRLQPKADKFYILGVVDDPAGRRTEKISTNTYTIGGQSWQETTKNVTVDKDTLKFNAQIGKRFSDLSLRAGLFSSTGGLGLDYHLWKDDLKLTFEAYDFRVDERPHLRAAVDYSFWKYFFVTAGVDNFLADGDSSQFFAGGGITFYDDDLKFLLTNAPKP
jgi:phospholipid/cholesterol/gamma-HCH transport system substrate-binding protein